MSKSQTEERKEHHIKICLEKDVESKSTAGFDDVKLVHDAIPELDLNCVDLSCKFFSKDIKAPIIVEAITGGARIARRINKNIATACEAAGIPFAVGSTRAALLDSKLWDTYQVRDVAPTIPIISNIGLVQLVKEYGPRDVMRSVREIGADAVAVHLNALQEAIQPEGDVNFRGGLAKLEELCRMSEVPVIVKETGAGISKECAARIEKAGAKMIDVAGLGGTSFSKVEYYRDKNDEGMVFSEWGIPTACAVAECRSASKLPIIASGGIRSGIDAAKAIALGANYAGFARPVLAAAMKSDKDVLTVIEKFKRELKTTMFLSGAADIHSLGKKDLVVSGKTAEWLRSRNIKF